MKPQKVNKFPLKLEKIQITKLENLISIKGGSDPLTPDEWTKPPTNNIG